jgi:hypothetical protein
MKALKMNKLIQMLLKEHSKKQRDKIVSYIGKDTIRFAKLVEAFLNGPYRITQRASWLLSSCIEKHPQLIRPHLKKVLVKLEDPEQHQAVKRNILRLLQYIDVPVKFQGLVANACFQLLSNPKETVAVHVFSMTVLANIIKQEPELGNELAAIIEQKLPYASPAFISRGRKVLSKLKKK